MRSCRLAGALFSGVLLWQRGERAVGFYILVFAVKALGEANSVLNMLKSLDRGMQGEIPGG